MTELSQNEIEDVAGGLPLIVYPYGAWLAAQAYLDAQANQSSAQ